MLISPLPLIDTGPLIDARAALWARLDTYFPSSHFTHADVPVRLTPAAWKRLLRRTPFVGLSWNGIAPDAANNRTFKGKSQWSVFLAARNEHALDARGTGAATGPGTFGMAQVAVVSLAGHTFAGLGSVVVTQVGNLTTDQNDDEAVSIVGINLDLPISFDAASVGAGALQDFLRVAVTWNFDPMPPGNPPAADDLYAVRT